MPNATSETAFRSPLCRLAETFVTLARLARFRTVRNLLAQRDLGRRLTCCWLFALGLVGVAAACATGLTFFLAASQRNHGAVINDAASQRARAQRIAAYLPELLKEDPFEVELARLELERILARMEEVFRSLVDGDGAPTQETATIAAHYFEGKHALAPRLARFLADARAILRDVEEGLPADPEAVAALRAEALGPVLGLLDEAVTLHEAHLRENVDRLLVASLGVGAGALFLLVAIGLWIFRPMTRALVATVGDLAALAAFPVDLPPELPTASRRVLLALRDIPPGETRSYAWLAARAGLLVRKRDAFERARELDTVVFDKTGTLTTGEFGVAAIATAPGITEEEALRLAAAAERESEHVMARAIVAAAQARGIEIPSPGHFEAIPGRGARARVQGREVLAGQPALLQELGAEPPPELRRAMDEAAERARSPVVLIVDRRPVALFALADRVRPESYEAVRKLKEQGIRVAMLTGDSEDVARAVARELGIDEVFARVLPEEKARRVQELKGRGLRVAMVGDGVNDAPALLAADVGIAIGAGTNVAIEAGDIVLVRNDPRDIARIITLSRASYRKMRQNLAWATGYNVVAIPLAAGVLARQGILLPPALGALLMSLSTVIVAINAQLLWRQRSELAG